MFRSLGIAIACPPPYRRMKIRMHPLCKSYLSHLVPEQEIDPHSPSHPGMSPKPRIAVICFISTRYQCTPAQGSCFGHSAISHDIFVGGRIVLAVFLNVHLSVFHVYAIANRTFTFLFREMDVACRFCAMTSSHLFVLSDFCENRTRNLVYDRTA